MITLRVAFSEDESSVSVPSSTDDGIVIDDSVIDKDSEESREAWT